MDWSKLTEKELQDFIDLNGLLASSKALFNCRTTETRFTEPIADLYIATNYQGQITQTYDIDKIRRLSKSNLKEFADIFGIEPNIHRLIRILTYMGVIITPNRWEIIPQDVSYRIALQLSYEDLTSLCSTSTMLAPLCRDVSFWRDKAILDFGVTAEKFNQTVQSDIHDVDTSLVLYAPSSLSTRQVMEDFSRHGPVYSVVRYPKFWVITYANSQRYAANRWTIYKYHGGTLYEDPRYGKGRLEKYNPELLQQDRGRLAYFALWRESIKQKIPRFGGAILLSDVNLALNVITEDFSFYGNISSIEKLGNDYVIIYTNNNAINSLMRDYDIHQSIFCLVKYANITIIRF